MFDPQSDNLPVETASIKPWDHPLVLVPVVLLLLSVGATLTLAGTWNGVLLWSGRGTAAQLREHFFPPRNSSDHQSDKSADKNPRGFDVANMEVDLEVLRLVTSVESLQLVVKNELTIVE
ncbi:hypothetical protein MPTK1_5g15590 [Marchantia polymorpha subsp. ruderalis]|uniref:Uncharacterized protein n=2 Tax=Marchantia polymorpha TaxID=3197 RepID=A0AAF6BIQ1_MARPO|nr:hypothetical protein MARPO_0071s0051 [Marchantia polymorpha]BBN11885.1 hypothetical protein Mp_5g15590 [Marchantia polymorpha subsp. ruderalis]|eukprot:PTQ35435.1 hypothetical protein MARPO_0071s0051 [Marchantia polymorpha]